MRKYEAQVFVDGELRTRMFRAPANFERWRSSWRFRNGAVALAISPPGSVDSYEDGIRDLSVAYPRAWGVICRADEVMRAEVWERMAEEQAPADGNWGDIIAQSAYGNADHKRTQWWFDHVIQPCLAHGSNPSGALQAVDAHEGVPAEATSREGKAPREAGQPRVTRAEHRNDRLQEIRASQSAAKDAASQERKKKLDEICNNWNSKPDGCRTPCPNGRKHVCARCGGPKRAVERGCPRKKK